MSDPVGEPDSREQRTDSDPSVESGSGPLFAFTDDGAPIAVYEVSRGGRYEQSVFMTHGTFSDARVCSRLARAIARLGFATYVMEWRGHGKSGLGGAPPSFEVTARRDVPAALALMRARTGRERVLWVGHSGGGLLAWMHLARIADDTARFDGIVALATQAAGAGVSLRGRAGIAGAAILTRVLGRAPGRSAGLGPQDETPSVMNEWYRWNWSKRWRGADGFDYEDAVTRVSTPALLLAGAGDRFIAPPDACRRFFETLGASDKKMVVCGRAAGFAEDYDHGRVIASRGAVREVWPLVTNWLVSRATHTPS